MFSACAGAAAPLSAQQPDRGLPRTGFGVGQLTDLHLQGGPALQRQKNENVGQLDCSHFIIIFNR